MIIGQETNQEERSNNMNYNQQYGQFNNPFNNITPEQKRKIKRVVITVIIVVAALIIGTTSWYTVEEKQMGVVTTFGKVTKTTEAGFHLKLPFGIQKVYKVDVNVHQKIEIGYEYDEKTGEYKTLGNESKMITGDFNIVNIDFFVEYKIYDPVKYLFSSINPEGILKSLIQSQIRTVVSAYKVEDVLTTEKASIQMECKELITEELEKYDIGLQLIDVKIQDAEAPTEEVIAAFKAVETAKQDKETALNEAKAYENQKLPEAQAESDKLIQEAEYKKQNRINEARQQIAMFNAIYKEYEINPSITKQRMYYEAIESILPGVKLIVITDENGTQTLLPIDKFTS